jgi:hypothetical protein
MTEKKDRRSISGRPVLSLPVQRYLRGLATTCVIIADTQDPKVAAVGIALISQAPVELARHLNNCK